tara:strand:- start:119 stop:559 length:441 start_codon:yes stop_codon:yes gene_type:complete
MIFIILLGCVEMETIPKAQRPKDDVFSERKRQLSFEKVMKTLPNIVDIRDTIDIVVYDKLREEDIENIVIHVYERPGSRIIYKGSLLGIMTLPRKRVRVPVSSSNHSIHANFYYPSGRRFSSELKILKSGEAIIRSQDFRHSIFEK